MERTRKISKVLKGRPTIEGAGVHLKRAFGYHQVPDFDPFLMLDDFHNTDPAHYLAGFPWHPHRGIETITYVMEGLVEHGDSMGNRGVIGPGDVQWMTAGSGIIHQEMPKESPSGTMWGFQLWANLPASHKMMEPRYQDVKADQIPEAVMENSVRIKIICGRISDKQGPAHNIVIDPTFLDVTIPPDTQYSHAIQSGHTALAYVIQGEGYLDEQRDSFAHEVVGRGWWDVDRPCLCSPEMVVLYERSGDVIRVTAGQQGLRFLLCTGKPLNEPVAWYGPIVMNTQEELRTALEEFQNGTFIKNRRPADKQE